MFCRNCGYNVNGAAKFCPNCGCEIRNIVQGTNSNARPLANNDRHNERDLYHSATDTSANGDAWTENIKNPHGTNDEDLQPLQALEQVQGHSKGEAPNTRKKQGSALEKTYGTYSKFHSVAFWDRIQMGSPDTVPWYHWIASVSFLLFGLLMAIALPYKKFGVWMMIAGILINPIIQSKVNRNLRMLFRLLAIPGSIIIAILTGISASISGGSVNSIEPTAITTNNKDSIAKKPIENEQEEASNSQKNESSTSSDLLVDTSAAFDKEWYKSGNRYSSIHETILEFAWLDDGHVQGLVNGTDFYTFMENNYTINEDGMVSYPLEFPIGFKLLYRPSDSPEGTGVTIINSDGKEEEFYGYTDIPGDIPSDNTTEDLIGYWISVPWGVIYNAEAIAINIYKVENNIVYYDQQLYTRNEHYANQAHWWTSYTDSSNSEIVDSDIDGIKCFSVQGGFYDIYIAPEGLYYKKYSEDRFLAKTPFTSFDECLNYYKTDYGNPEKDPKTGGILVHPFGDTGYEGGLTVSENDIDYQWYLSKLLFENRDSYGIWIRINPKEDGKVEIIKEGNSIGSFDPNKYTKDDKNGLIYELDNGVSFIYYNRSDGEIDVLKEDKVTVSRRNFYKVQ